MGEKISKSKVLPVELYTHSWAQRIYINFLERSVAMDDSKLAEIKKMKLQLLDLPAKFKEYADNTKGLKTIGDLLKITPVFLISGDILSSSVVEKVQQTIYELIQRPDEVE